MSDKRAPVQGYTPGIPWEMHLRAYDVYCEKYGGQKALIDLEGRNCRGGFSTGELDDFIPGWREELSDEIATLRSQLAEARTGERERCAKWLESARVEIPTWPDGMKVRIAVASLLTKLACELRALSHTTPAPEDGK